MLWLPVLFLMVTMLFVGTAFALMFCRVAFAGWNDGAAQSSLSRDLSMMSGKQLQSWAANLAHRVVARHAHQPRSAETPLAIAIELEAGANAVLERVAERTHSEVAKTCPNSQPQQIAVTAPEVFAIAAELERRYPMPERQFIREVAVLNARRVRFLVPEEYPQAGINCPLRTSGGQCLTFASRPIACRRWCPSCSRDREMGSGDSCGKTSEVSFDATEVVRKGLSCGLSEGLRQAGLDDGVYELNDALSTALTTPHAAARWSRGEPVFASCVKA